MKNSLSAKEWESFFLDRGISGEFIPQYLEYIRKLNKNSVPIIFEFEHFSNLLGIKKTILAAIINSSRSFYRIFSIPKKKGGFREITAPYPSLLHCQKWIYKNILLSQDVHKCAHGFVPKRSIITNAQVHLSSNCLLKMDLKDFFPSVPINWVIRLFQNLGYANNVSFYLASICCYDGALGQGSPASPYLTNILLKKYDEKLYRLGLSYNLNYSRYADDITFSGNYIPCNFINIIEIITSEYGLNINKKKTVLYTKPGKRIVTGLSVNGKSLTLPRSAKREIKKDVYFIKTFGYLSHITSRKIADPFYLDSLLGRLAFWRQVEPNNPFVGVGIDVVKNVMRELK